MKRLPFHSVILDPFAVLSLELNDSTLPRLLPVGKVLDIPSDKFYEHVIQRKVTLLQNQIKTKSQSLSKLGYISFNDFRPLLTKIKDFQQAISLSVFVGGNFPRGEDRIAAYRISLSFSQKWIASLATDTSSMIEKAQTGAAKVKGLLNVAETEHVLQTHGLQIFDKYVPKPSMLLMKLLTLNPSNPPLSADIYHSIASEIAERSSIDIEKVKLMLLQRWLSDNDGEVSDVQIQERVLFLLHQKLEWGISNLKAFAKQPTNKVRTESRIRALAILYRISKMPEKLLDSAVIEYKLINQETTQVTPLSS
jgi:hypothetical protein